MRFPDATDDPAQARRYLENRAVQALIDGWHAWPELEPTEWGVRGRARSAEGVAHQTFYVYSRFRGQGRVAPALRAAGLPVVTTPDCGLEPFLSKHGLPYTVICGFTQTPEYLAIAAFYGDRRAERSDLPYMNHIDEGLAVLRVLEASDAARRAFCLHPLVQNDGDLIASFSTLDAIGASPSTWALAFEYRRIANAALSTRVLEKASDIELGPLADVAVMLRADKLQNQKDFERHHLGSHPRSAQLERYFALWLERLEVSPELAARCRAAMEPFLGPP